MSLLPPNASPFERAIESVISRDVPVPIRDVHNPDTCPESLLPWLAWGLSVDDWDANWPVEVKRQVIRESIRTHKIKGTRRSVENAVTALGSQIVIREWWQESPPRPPFTFRVILTLSHTQAVAKNGITDELQKSLVRAIDANKPVRSHYEITLGINASGRVRLQAAGRVAIYRRIKISV